jgi:uncharacterized membrane protein
MTGRRLSSALALLLLALLLAWLLDVDSAPAGQEFNPLDYDQDWTPPR